MKIRKDDPAMSDNERQVIATWMVRAAADACGPREFLKFAHLISQFSEPLGRVVMLHARAADGNSPDVDRWQTHTFQVEYPAVKDMTPEQAETWWENQYS